MPPVVQQCIFLETENAKRIPISHVVETKAVWTVELGMGRLCGTVTSET